MYCIRERLKKMLFLFLARNGRNLDIIKACGMSTTLLRLPMLCEGDCSQCDGCSITCFVVVLFEKGNTMV